MTVGPISAASLSQSILSSSNSTQMQQILKNLQNSLTSGDIKGAQTALQSLQKLFKNSATASGSTLSSTSQLSTDLTALGSALSSGDLSTAKSAFATVQKDLKTSLSPLLTNEINAASQSVQLVKGLLGSADSTDNSNSILQSVYEKQSGLNILA